MYLITLQARAPAWRSITLANRMWLGRRQREHLASMQAGLGSAGSTSHMCLHAHAPTHHTHDMHTYTTHNHTQHISQHAHMYTNFPHIKHACAHTLQNTHENTRHPKQVYIRHTLHQTNHTHRLIDTHTIMCYTHIMHILDTNTHYTYTIQHTLKFFMHMSTTHKKPFIYNSQITHIT